MAVHMIYNISEGVVVDKKVLSDDAYHDHLDNGWFDCPRKAIDEMKKKEEKSKPKKRTVKPKKANKGKE